MARCLVMFAIACAGFATIPVKTAVGESADECSHLEDSEALALLQTSPARSATAGPFHCSPRSLVAGAEVRVTNGDTYLQWNGALRAQGADFVEFLNVTQNGEFPSATQSFDRDVDFVKCGRPVYGIVYFTLPGSGNLVKRDALKLKAYIDAGGMLVVGEAVASQVNALMEDLGSSIRQGRNSNFDCSTPEDAPYLPNKYCGSSLCPLTRGVTGLQGTDVDEVLDPEDSSYPLFHFESDSGAVAVARVEKARNLVVVGDDEIFDDACATFGKNNRLAFGLTTNLRFFKNLFKERCRDER